jgi:amino acid adenylation domain-containing protein
MEHNGSADATWLVHEAIAGQAVEHPRRAAMVSGKAALTYEMLIENANSVKSRLRAAGVRAAATVACSLSRGVALGPAVLGTWLSGGAYLPLDPEGPPERRDHMLRDSSPAAILATAQTASAFGQGSAPVVVVDELGAAVAGPGGEASAATPPVSASDLAYVIYTSGSTGKPKGVMVEHGNLAAMARSHEATLYTGQGRHPRNVALNNVTIADSFFSDFVHLAYGRTLHVVDGATRRDPDRLAQFLGDHDIDVLDATPTQIRTMMLADRAGSLASLDVLVLGGEATDPDLWRQLRRPGVYNLYGPTECTVAVTAAAFRDHPSPMLGSPLPGCAVWVVDEALRQVPDGEAGELLVTGAQVARGYLNPGAAEAARFVSFLPPGAGQPVRAYRTGDRGRRNRGGQLEFLGRTDSQVSVGGHRVEIGEVEAALSGCPGVRVAAVAARRDQHVTTLVAYAVLAEGTSVEHVRSRLAAILPGHMIPVITVVTDIPMGPTGKADLARLTRDPGAGNQPETVIRGAPEDSDVADAIRQVWLETLGVAAVDPGDDFFALGGDSAKATQAIVALRENLLPDIPIRVLFDHPGFREFCAAARTYLRGPVAFGKRA